MMMNALWLSVRPETEVLFREARQALDKERGERLDDDAVIEALCRAFLSRGARTAEALRADATSVPRGTKSDSRDASASGGAAPYRVAVTVCTECKRGWRHGGGAVAEMSPAAVECAQCDAQWIGDVGSHELVRARQEISPATRRMVLHRDQGRCGSRSRCRMPTSSRRETSAPERRARHHLG